MESQIQTLKKQRRRLIVVCCILALTMFVAGIYAFVQRGIALVNSKGVIEAKRRTIQYEEEAWRQRYLAEEAMGQLQEKEKQLTQARTESALLKNTTSSKRMK